MVKRVYGLPRGLCDEGEIMITGQQLSITDFIKAKEALEKANVPNEKLVLTPKGLYSLEETDVGTLWHLV